MNRKILIAVFFAYVLLSFAATYPLIEKGHNHIYGYEDLSDPVAWIWCLHWTYHALTTSPLDLYDSNRLYPMEYSYVTNYQPIPLQLLFAPAYFITGNQVFATNFTLIATFFLCGFFMFLLVRRFTGVVWISFCAGCIFAFSPIRLPSEQLHNQASFWMPLTMLLVDRYYHDFKLRHLLGGALFAVFQLLTSFETGMMLVFAIIIYFAVKKGWSVFKNKSILIHHGIAILVYVAVAAPFMYPYYYLQQRYGFTRSLGEIIQFSADPVHSYFLAKSENRLFSWMDLRGEYDPFPGEERLFQFVVGFAARIMGEDVLSSKLGLERLPGDSLAEKISLKTFHDNINRDDLAKPLFQGFVTMALALLGIVTARRFSDAKIQTFRNIFFVILIAGFIMSLGPVLILCGHLTYIPMPYLVLYYLVPGVSAIRGVYRFMYMVSFALSVLAGLGMYFLEFKRMHLKQAWARSRLAGYGLCVIITVLALADSWTVPAPVAAIPVGKNIPEVYQWIAGNGVKGIMVEIPTVKGTLSKHDENPRYAANRKMYHDRELEYMYYSTYHFSKMVNGAASFVPKERQDVLDALYRLPDPEAVEFLREKSIQTFVLHRDRFEPEDEAVWTEENIALMGLQEVFRSGPITVWRMAE